MNIPDGYLAFPICLISYLLMIPLFVTSIYKLKKKIKLEFLPLVAVGVAFSFSIMMLNVDIVGGTNAHAIGAGVLSFLVGPWISSLVITIALIFQALLFKEGGVLTIGINSLIIAYVSSFSSYYIYKFFSYKYGKFSSKIVAAALSGYVSLSLSAILTAVILGIQTILYNYPGQTSIYFPYSIKLVISSILVEHLLIFSWVEAFITSIIVGIFLKDRNLLDKLILNKLYSE